MRPEKISAIADGGKGRRAVVIRKEWTSIANDEIVTRIRGVIEARHDLRPVTTYGTCAECTALHTIVDMEEHVSAHHYELERVRDEEGDEEGALPIKIVDHYDGAPWMLALAKPGATLGDLGRFLEEKWVSRYNPDAKRGAVKFGPRPISDGLDPGTALSGLPDCEVTAWCSGTERLRVSVAGPEGVIRLREPVKAYALAKSHHSSRRGAAIGGATAATRRLMRPDGEDRPHVAFTSLWHLGGPPLSQCDRRRGSARDGRRDAVWPHTACW